MTPEQREIAQFYAQLASIKSLDDLRAWERSMLEDKFKDALWLQTYYFFRGAKSENRKQREQLKENFLTGLYRTEFNLDGLLRFLQPQLRKIIGGLVDGDEVEIEGFQLPVLRAKLSETREVREQIDHQEPKNIPFFVLHEFLHFKPFPFRRCPVCQSIFVPVRQQRNCSANCTYQKVEGARRERLSGGSARAVASAKSKN